MQTLLKDLRYGLRLLGRSPGFTLAAVLTLALGIGANTAVFSVVDAALLRPLPFGKPSSLVMIWGNDPVDGILRFPVSPSNFFDWEGQNRCFSGMAAFAEQSMVLTGAGQPEQVDAEEVSPNFFSVLGMAPMLGRGFSRGEDQTGKSNVVVLTYGLWQSHFAGDPNVIGKTVQLNGRPVIVIGVAGPDFDFYIREHSPFGEPPQLWAPLEVPPEWHQWSNKAPNYLRLIARLKPDISVSQAQAQMNLVAANLAARYPEYDKASAVMLIPLRDQFSGELRAPLFILLGAVGLVLLIACANLSSLLLSRASGRRHELAIRLALGASRSRVTGQLLMESVLLGVLGGATGTFVAVWATKALIHAGSLDDLRAGTVDWRVLTFAASVALLAGLLAGFLPSFLAARGEIVSALSGGRRTSASRQGLAARHAFVVLEISLALVLLAGSSLLIRSFFRLIEVNPGFDVAHLLTFQVTLSDPRYGQETARAIFFSQLLGEIGALPGVVSATADIAPPFDGLGLTTPVAIVGAPPRPSGQAPLTLVRVIEPAYFHTMGIPVLGGRTFSERELAQPSNAVIINKAFAERYFRGENPLGKKIILYMAGVTGKADLPDEIIGVVGDVHESSLAVAPRPLAYWPYPEAPYKVMTVVVRTATPPLSLVPAVRGALHRIDKDQPMAKISTMEQHVANSLTRSRFITLLLSTFAGLALVLACIGIYGVMAYSVAQRTHEIGIRMALGGQTSHMLTMVIRQGLKLALIGVGAGIAGAFVLTRLLSGLLYGVQPYDPLTFVTVSLVLTGTALLACYIPARRAMRVDPLVALRYE